MKKQLKSTQQLETKYGYILYHTGVYNGVGTLNANKDGTPKSINLGPHTANRTSAQKIKYGIRHGLEELGYINSTQTRELFDLFVGLAKRPDEANDEAAKVWVTDLMVNFLGHKEEKDEKKKKDEKDEGSKWEVVRYTATDVDYLKDQATRRGKGESIDAKELKMPKAATVIEEDILLFGVMRPVRIDGCFKVANGIGTSPIVEEKDFFTASDDLLERGQAHLDIRYLSRYCAYQYALLNVNAVVAYYKGDLEKTNRLVQACTQLIQQCAPKSNANSSPNQGLVFYLMAEKTLRNPCSLEVAFQEPAETTSVFVQRIRKYKEAFDKAYSPKEYMEWCSLPDFSANTMEEINGFLTIK